MSDALLADRFRQPIWQYSGNILRGIQALCKLDSSLSSCMCAIWRFKYVIRPAGTSCRHVMLCRFRSLSDETDLLAEGEVHLSPIPPSPISHSVCMPPVKHRGRQPSPRDPWRLQACMHAALLAQVSLHLPLLRQRPPQQSHHTASGVGPGAPRMHATACQWVCLPHHSPCLADLMTSAAPSQTMAACPVCCAKSACMPEDYACMRQAQPRNLTN